MNDFEKGFNEELEKLSVAAPYSIHFRAPEEEEEEELKRRRLLGQLIGTGGLTAGGALMGASHSGKGALIGAGLGAGVGGGLTALRQVLPTKRIFELEDPTGSYGSGWSRFWHVPVPVDVIRSEGGEPEVL
jgi:hypothetical protein